MEKKKYITPAAEITVLVTSLMKDLGPASLPAQTGTSAPSRKVPVLGNDSVKAF